MRNNFIGVQAALAASLLLVACGGDSDTPAVKPPAVASYTVGGSASGLTGTLVLQNNAGDDLTLSASGPFSFDGALAAGSAYAVSVRTQPLWQFCTVTQGSGKVSANVADVAVACTAAVAQVSTWAGSGSFGSDDGQGEKATFEHPRFLAVRQNGSLLVSDTSSNLLRKISPTGDVTSFDDKSKSIKVPAGLALDAAGNAYLADLSAKRVHKITPEDVITTLPGSGLLSTPYTTATDAAGNIYVADADRLRKITPAGEMTTLTDSGFANTGTSEVDIFSYGLATDRAGNIYMSDISNHAIRKITSDGVLTTLAGPALSSPALPGSADGAGSLASFNTPASLAVDSDGNVYVADVGNHAIRKITPQGLVSTLAGKSGDSGKQDGMGTDARFTTPFGVTVAADGSVYVADTGNHLIRKITPVPAP